jgi:hypothetical protein
MGEMATGLIASHAPSGRPRMKAASPPAWRFAAGQRL